MEHFDAATQRFAKAAGAHRQDHELLNIDVVVRVGAAVDDVHHGHRQARVGSAVEFGQMAKERLGPGGSGGFGVGQRNGKDGVGAETAFLRRAVEFDHGVVHGLLLRRIETAQRLRDGRLDVGHRALHAPSAVARRAAVAQFHRLPGSGGRAGWRQRQAALAGVQEHFGLDGWIAAGIQCLAGHDGSYRAHGAAASRKRCRFTSASMATSSSSNS